MPEIAPQVLAPFEAPAILLSQHVPAALVASGGMCMPLSPLYDFTILAT